jgi:hypothetical protein
MMNRKNLLMLSILSTAVVLSACGSDAGDISEKNTEAEIVASVDTETETTEETTETEKMESTEIADTEVESTQTVDAENETEAVASGEFTDTYEDTRPADEVEFETSANYDLWQNTEFGEYGQTSMDQASKNYVDYAKSQGADGAREGYYWYYEKGSAAGDKGSYLVYMKEGSPYYGQVFQYGDTLLDGTQNLNGTNQEYYDWVNEGATQKLIDAGATITYKEDGTAVFDLDTISD